MESKPQDNKIKIELQPVDTHHNGRAILFSVKDPNKTQSILILPEWVPQLVQGLSGLGMQIMHERGVGKNISKIKPASMQDIKNLNRGVH